MVDRWMENDPLRPPTMADVEADRVARQGCGTLIWLFVLFPMLILMGLGIYAAEVLPHVIDAAKSPKGRICATVTVLVGAVLLYVLRVFHRTIYGFLEFCLGLLAVWYSLARLEPELTTAFVVLVTGAYFLIRAFDNIHQGLVQAGKASRQEKRSST